MQSTAVSAIINKQQSDPLLDDDEAAAYIDIKPKTLPVWRSTGRYSIPYIKIGRLVRYRKSVLDEFLKRRTIGDDS